MKILIAEDNEMNQKVLKAICDRNQLSYEFANDGLEALKLISNKHFDLILMDCQMPVMDGYEATKLIRETESKVSKIRCPIVAITANAMQGDREKCLAVGMDDFVAKPFRSKDIIELVQKWSKK